MGPPKCFDVSLPACHSLRTPADLHILATARMLRVGFGGVKTLAIRNKRDFEAVPAFRARGCPYGLQDSLCTLHLSCSATPCRLRHRRNTRYGWVASPCPAGTCTQQDTPSLAWRDNARAEPPPRSAATRAPPASEARWRRSARARALDPDVGNRAPLRCRNGCKQFWDQRPQFREPIGFRAQNDDCDGESRKILLKG